jgi:uncharacterized membrane protein YfcA
VLLFLFGFFCGLFFGVALVLLGVRGLALVSPVYTSCVRRGALRFFSQQNFTYL